MQKVTERKTKISRIKITKYHGMKLTKITEYHNDKKYNTLNKNIKNTNEKHPLFFSLPFCTTTTPTIKQYSIKFYFQQYFTILNKRKLDFTPVLSIRTFCNYCNFLAFGIQFFAYELQRHSKLH